MEDNKSQRGGHEAPAPSALRGCGSLLDFSLTSPGNVKSSFPFFLNDFPLLFPVPLTLSRPCIVHVDFRGFPTRFVPRLKFLTGNRPETDWKHIGNRPDIDRSPTHEFNKVARGRLFIIIVIPEPEPIPIYWYWYLYWYCIGIGHGRGHGPGHGQGQGHGHGHGQGPRSRKFFDFRTDFPTFSKELTPEVGRYFCFWTDFPKICPNIYSSLTKTTIYLFSVGYSEIQTNTNILVFFETNTNIE